MRALGGALRPARAAACARPPGGHAYCSCVSLRCVLEGRWVVFLHVVRETQSAPGAVRSCITDAVRSCYRPSTHASTACPRCPRQPLAWHSAGACAPGPSALARALGEAGHAPLLTGLPSLRIVSPHLADRDCIRAVVLAVQGLLWSLIQHTGALWRAHTLDLAASGRATKVCVCIGLCRDVPLPHITCVHLYPDHEKQRRTVSHQEALERPNRSRHTITNRAHLPSVRGPRLQAAFS